MNGGLKSMSESDRPFELTVYGEFSFLSDESGDDQGPHTCGQITFTEEMLQRGILDGTLTEGVFNPYRTKPPRVWDWPRPYQKLKTAYSQPFMGINEPDNKRQLAADQRVFTSAR